MRIENSFICVDGVGEATERRLWGAGITHWDEFDGSGPGLGETRARRVAEFIDVARDRLEAADATFFADALPSGSSWRLYENFRDRACFFDIETTGLSRERDDVTVVSLRRGGETTTLVRGDGLSRERLAAELADASLLVSFNGRRFDEPFLETAFGLDLGVPHLDLLYPCESLGLTGGLKAVEREVGIERDRPDVSGRDAVRLWREYQRGDDAALSTLVSYNRADVDNLVPLAEQVVTGLHEDVFVGGCEGQR